MVREIGLGATHTRSLAEAREVAEAMRKAVAAGADPALVIRKEEPQAPGKTFEECAAEMIEAKRAGWKNAKHAQQWANTLRDYAFPVIGSKLLADVSLADVKAILLPMWASKTVTALQVRGRIEAVLDYAAVHDLCDGARNPARWKGTLDKVLPSPRKVANREHHAAAPYADVPRVMAALSEKSHVSAQCLKFTILAVGGTRQKLSMLASVTNQGKARWMIIDGAFNHEKLIECFEALVADAGRKVFLILDNLGVHHCKPVKAWLAEHPAQMEVFYLPSYSPELNPEERLNADLKHVIGHKVPARSKAKLHAATEEHMAVIGSEPERVKASFRDPYVKYAA
jgi:transposase